MKKSAAGEHTGTTVPRKEGLIATEVGNIHYILYHGSQPSTASRPTAICFHGSGNTGATSWQPLAQLLSSTMPVLLFDRPGTGMSTSPPQPTTNKKVPESRDLSRMLQQILKALDIPPPFVLIAHSFGGKGARDFLQRNHRNVAGLVLAETGQETPSVFEQRQNEQQIMGARPVSVICANSFLSKLRQLEELESKAGDADGPEDQSVKPQRIKQELEMINLMRTEDVRLKKVQMQLSRNSKFRDVPDCGHDIIKQCPDVVAEECQWVLAEWHRLPKMDNSKQIHSASSWRIRVEDLLHKVVSQR